MSLQRSQSVLRIDADAFRAVWDHARRDDPHEACGIITSGNRSIPIRNASPRSLVAYQFDAAQQLETWQDMARRAETLAVIYHSHTARDAMASGTDHALAAYPEAFYLIVSTHDMSAHAFVPVDGRLTEVPIEVVPSISPG